LRRVITRRFLGVLWRRHREGFEFLRALVGFGSPLGRALGRFASVERRSVGTDG
jgi:hypothetical protein